MDRAGPIRRTQGQFRSNSFGLCRYTLWSPLDAQESPGTACVNKSLFFSILYQVPKRQSSRYPPLMNARKLLAPGWSLTTPPTLIPSIFFNFHTPDRSPRSQLIYFQLFIHSGGEGGEFIVQERMYSSFLHFLQALFFQAFAQCPSLQAVLIQELAQIGGGGGAILILKSNRAALPGCGGSRIGQRQSLG
jgi:hypothetical protein